MYTAIVAFTDSQDGNRVYHTGDIYPQRGTNVSDERIAQLASGKNKLGFPVIALVHEIDPDGEPALKSHEKPVSQASDSLGEVLPGNKQKAVRGRKNARQKSETKR